MKHTLFLQRCPDINEMVVKETTQLVKVGKFSMLFFLLLCYDGAIGFQFRDISRSVSKVQGSNGPRLRVTLLRESPKSEDEVVVELGSKEYMQGMIRRSVDEEPLERVSGDKVLGPTLRLAGGVTGVLIALVLAFLVSNGIILF